MRARAASLLLLALAAPAASAAVRGVDGARSAAGMVQVPAGSYLPLHGRAGDARVAVRAFWLDRDPVTRGQFLAFARTNPRWALPRTAATTATDPASPVTGVTWFAARAYCESLGKRLPSLHEWEYAAAASATRRDATRDPAFVQQLVSLYASRPRPLPPVAAAGAAGVPNAYGVRGLHGLAWEWVAEANGAPAAGHDHRQHRTRDGDASCAGAAIGAVDPANYPAFLRFALRSGLTAGSALDTLGFRCAS